MLGAFPYPNVCLGSEEVERLARASCSSIQSLEFDRDDTTVSRRLKTPVPPPAERLGCRSPLKREYVRLAWWTLKGVRRHRGLVALIVATALLFAFGAVSSGVFHPVLAVLLTTVGLGAYLLLATVLLWISFAWRKRCVIYMSLAGDAVIVLQSHKRRPVWEAKNHIAKHIGMRSGAALRATMETPLLEAAAGAGVEIFGKAANAKVQRLYLDQFEAVGLTPDGPKGVILS